MASRRMFSMKIINSARFMKMPISTQLLYFHLGLNADDDGIVEGYTVIRMTGCSEDDLKILVAKNFIIVLNEDLVSFVTDWNEHNSIRPDRKIDSIYKDLLLKIVSGVEIVVKKPRADVKRIVGPTMDSTWTADGPQMDRIGKVRLGEDRIGKVIEEKLKKNVPVKIKYAEFVNMTNVEYDKLIQEHGTEKVKKMIEILDNYKGSNNKTYANDYRAILSWVVKKVTEDFKTDTNKTKFKVV